jgi:ATP-dependent Zn protease
MSQPWSPYQQQPPPPGPSEYAPPGRSRARGNLFGWVLFIGLAVMLFVILSNQNRHTTPIALSEFCDELTNGNVSAVTIDGDILRGDFTRPVGFPGVPGGRIATFRTDLPTGTGASWPFVQWLYSNSHHATIRVENSGSILTNLIAPFIPWLLIFVFIWFFVFRQLRNNRMIAAAAPAPAPVAPQVPVPLPVVIVNPESRP